MHVDNGLEAIAAGIPALIEKPIDKDIAGGLKMIEAAERSGIPILTGHHRRHNQMTARQGSDRRWTARSDRRLSWVLLADEAR